MDKNIGKLLGGRYEIIDVVGVGGMAIVYRARCHVLNRYVAVKILKDEYAKDPDIRKRFSIESQAVAKLSHHNIVSVYDVGSENGTDYIVMELMEGITLKEYLQKKGRLCWQEALFFAEQICRALVHAHSRGIIHQDIKPQNVIILRDGTAKLTDFGIARFATTQETRVVQEAIGSVHYISPEQAKGSKIDYRTDIYSLGVVMYEMLTGKLPFEGETALQVVMQHLNAVPLAPSGIQPDIPEGMDSIVMHAMCASAARRYASAEELYADLERLKADEHAHFSYSAAETDEHTHVLDAEVQRAVRHTQIAPERDREPEQRRRQTDTIVREREGFFDKLGERPGLAAAVTVAIIVVIALFVVGALIATGGGNGEEKIAVPLLVGRDIDEVMADPEVTENFTIHEDSQRRESNRPVGEILEQDPVPSTRVVKGTNITLTVSAGGANVEDSYKIIDFKGRTIEYAATILNEHGVAYTTEEMFDEELPKGQIVRTDPPAGEKLAKGAVLTLYISKGAEKKQTETPDLYGMTQSAAKKALEDKKLVLGTVSETESAEPAGTVIWQSVEKGKPADEGTVVDIQLSKGNAPDQQEPDPPDETDPPPAPPEPAMGSASISVTLPTNTDQAHVIILVDGGIAHDQTYPVSAGGQVTVTVPGTVGTHEVTVTVDGNSTTSTYTFS